MENERTCWDELCEYVEISRQQHDVPGVVLGVVHDGQVLTKGFGITNLDHPLEVTDKTLFQIGSITKTYTGTLVMKLVEEGEMDLDASVRSYLPDFRVADEEVSKQVTVRHLMTHTSGWFGDFFFDSGSGRDAIARYVAEMADLEQLAPLGQVLSYNNAAFSLLGRIIEVVTGASYQDALRINVFQPLGLTESYFDPGEVITRRFAVGHNEGQVARPWPLPRSAYAAGGITCSIHDLLRFARFHMGDVAQEEGEELLSAAAVRDMQRPQATVWKEEGWGLTWEVNDTYHTRLVSHSGGTMGQGARLVMAPEEKFAVGVLTNAAAGGKVIREVVRHALDGYLGIKVTDPEPRDSDEEELRPLVGEYQRPFADLHLELLGGNLVGQITYKMGFPDKDDPPPPPPPPFRLGVIEEDRLMVLDGPSKSSKVEVIREEDGSIGWLRMGRVHKKID